MATPYVTGPVDIWVGVGTSGAPVFLGHGERAPRIRIRRPYRDLYCDLAGDSVPFDRAHGGQMAIVSVALTRWNEPVYKIMADAATTNAGGNLGSRGILDPGAVGTLMLAEGIAYPLWLRFPYVAKAVFAAAGMPAGYHFAAAMLDQEDDLDELGPRPRKLGLTWTCLNLFDLTVANAYGAGRQRLYDHDMTAVSGGIIN